jgi:hypothetical protein
MTKQIPWDKTEYHLVSYRKRVNNYLEAVIEKSKDDDQWKMMLVDYDDSCGAIAYFDYLHEALDSYESFLLLAIDAYEKKYAKYGNVPVIRMNQDGSFYVDLG